MLHALAIAFAVVAAGLIVAAIVGMVTGRPSDRAGFVIRGLAVVCFATAVALNVAAH
jgi:cytochrome c oxidase subunit IV